MHKELFWFDDSLRLLCLVAVNQFRAPGTHRVKANAKLGSALSVHAQECSRRSFEESEART
jgi:hypothetical protein